MSDVEEMDSDKEEYLPASQIIEAEKEKEQAASQTAQKEQTEASQNKTSKTTKTKNTKEPAGAVQYPCIYCGKNAAKGAVQCTICSLWCHMTCTGLSKEAIKGLEVQAKEVGLAYWACRSCMSFNNKWNNQMRVVCKRQDETEARVENNSDKIEEVRKITEELRHELREQVKKTEGLQERMETALDSELREREARRLNLVIHGLQEPEASLKDPRERMERDKEECERLFIAMKARTRYQAVRFCRRIGERGTDPRPVVFGVYSEEEKRHLLEKSKELRSTRYENVTIVPDMTKSQRRGEQKLREEADRRNELLTTEDRDKNLKWIVVGKRGEKRLIKGEERDGQWGQRDRERGTGATGSGWNPQIRVNTGPMIRGQNNQRNSFGPDRRPDSQNWRQENHNNGGGQSGRQNSGYSHNNGGGQYGRQNDSYSNNIGGGNYGGNYGGGNNGGSQNGRQNNGYSYGNNNYGGGGFGGGQGGGNSGGNSTQISSGGFSGGQRSDFETGARNRFGGAPPHNPENSNNGELDLQVRQQVERQVVEDNHAIRNIHQQTEDLRMPILLPRPPITRQPVWEGGTRLGSQKRGRSYDGQGVEEEEPPPRSRRF